MANVTGPGSSTDTAIARWNGVTGTVIQDSNVTVDSAGNISGVTATIADSSTKLATTAFVGNAIRDAVLFAGSAEGGYAADVSTDSLGNLNATYSNGTSGVGATLTNAGTQAALSIDGVSMIVGYRVLVVAQTTGAQNGIYSVTTVGNGSTNWVLTRTTDYNTTTPMNDHRYIAINYGTLNANNAYQQTATITTIGTDSLTFLQSPFCGAGYVPRNLKDAYIIIGQGGLAGGIPMSGDATIDDTGKVTIKPAYNSIGGCLPSSIAGTHTTATMTVSAGQAADSTNAVYITGAGYSWAVSNGNAINGYQGGTTLPNSSTIHMYLCTGASGTGVFASTSLTPTLPTGYVVSYRRIFSFNTNASGAPIPYTAIEAEGGSTINFLTTQIEDISTTTLGTSRTLYTLTVPSGIKVEPYIRAFGNTSSVNVLLTSGDETDVAPYGGGFPVSTAPGYDIRAANVINGYQPFLITNTSGQIGARSASASTALYATTRGFKDFRKG